MANIVLLLVIIMLVFSVIGVTLFRDVVPMYFGNLSSCIFSYNCFPYSERGGGGGGGGGHHDEKNYAGSYCSSW